MKRIIPLILLCVFLLVGCTLNNTDIGEPISEVEKNQTVFDTKNIKSVSFFTHRDETCVAVDSEHLDEIIQWLGSFRIDERVVGNVLEPGSDFINVRIEYDDGAVVENGMTSVTVNGDIYYMTSDPAPDCYFDVFSDETEEEKWDLVPMVMVDGVLYYDTGHNNNTDLRCGNLDGEITSTVEGWEIPSQNNQSNFGIGYGYQYGSTEGTVDINLYGKWRIFATEEVRNSIQFPIAVE